ncbi:MAG: MmcQ/YjbR family DNA-binding protein [Bryobacteraceae bacterium]|nr:MmcQ/YjbR family DNA-binding protein [Bryobacteraceae bacterium]
MQPAHTSVLERVRALCMALPEATETRTFGNPTFQVTGKTFCVLETYRGEFSIAVKVGKSEQSTFLADERFFRTPYVGRYGWVSLKCGAAAIDWDEVQGLVESSYRQIAPPRLVLELASPGGFEPPLPP